MCSGRVLFAPPPKESIAFIFVCVLTCIAFFPRMDTLDDVATIEVISTPLFIDFVSKKTLGWVRLSLASVFFLSTCYRMATKGYIMRTNYLERSKLRTIPINIEGIRSQVMFTSWCCNLLTLSFAINGFITLLSESSNKNTIFHSIFHHKMMLRFAVIIFEVAAPISMLVSCVVRYALWPQSMKGPVGSFGFRRPSALIQHNLNVVASLMEVGILGKMPIRLSEIVLAPMWGILYIFFTWFITHRLLDSKEPQFLYFFFDTTLGPKTNCLVLLSLLVVQAIFFILFTIIDDVLAHLDLGFQINIVILILVASVTCRFRD